MRTMFLLALMIIQACGPSRSPTPNTAFVSPVPDHTKFTAMCSTCHEAARYPAVDGVPHGFGRDCRECHTYTPTTPWQPIPFAHNPKPNACLGCHPKDRPAAPHVQTVDCVGCHNFPAWLPPVP